MPPQINLQPGSNNAQAVKQLQDYLVSQGLMTQAQVNTGYGTYGPQTKAAVAALQQKLGVNAGADAGFYGPLTQTAIKNVQSTNTNSNPTPPQPKTQAELDSLYSSAVVSHPTLAGNTPEAITYATSSGDFSQLVNAQGKPFSAEDQAAAVSQASTDLNPYYAAEQTKETADTEASLAAKKLAFDNSEADNATKFQAEKSNQDQTAANNGVLFSGGRAQKLQQLGESYARTSANNRTSTASDIGSTARAFGYKYGDTAANGLSSYYSLGGNTYNPNVATGGVGSSGLSSIYNANNGFQGTEVNTAKAAVQKRAAGFLANKGNKLVASGYLNQF